VTGGSVLVTVIYSVTSSVVVDSLVVRTVLTTVASAVTYWVLDKVTITRFSQMQVRLEEGYNYH